MLLRLRVRGFKNLQDVTVRFGPLTCFVGHNGVGKSNIFDAIQFLKLLAEHDIQEAAAKVRKPQAGGHGPLDLFLDRDPTGLIQLDADILVPKTVNDDWQRPAEAKATLLTYSLGLRYSGSPAPRIELDREELSYHKLVDAPGLIGFATSAEFRKAALVATRRGERFISTDEREAEKPKILLHQDGGSRGQPFSPGSSPRTVLGGTNSMEYPTVLAARREMASWRFLQLEPSAMRSPDPDNGTSGITEHGGGIAATLHALSRSRGDADVLIEATNDLRNLNEHVDAITVDVDQARNQLVLQARMRGSDQWLSPRSLSDGTLRFLALVTLKLDPDTRGMIALEEPENGIHPARVPALVRLLRDMAVDPRFSPEDDNPLRQVIVNTHSPDVVRQLAEDELLWVEEQATQRGSRCAVRHIAGSWRDRDPDSTGVAGIDRQRVAGLIGGAPVSSFH